MEENDAVIPDVAEFARATVREIEEIPQGSSLDETWASLGKYAVWSKALKPYLLDRIDALIHMSEIDFNGKETTSEIGIRYLICGGIAKELQDIITKVEMTKQVMEQLRKEQKNES